MDLKTKQRLKKFVNTLAVVRGRHTELVSVYIPAGYELVKIIGHLKQEQGTASNIKDARTRANVTDSLERIVKHLQLFKKTPENGLVVFAGDVSKVDNKVDIQVYSIEPPEPLKVKIYRCDQTFYLDLLKDMMEHREVYGLVVMDKRECAIGILRGTSIKMVEYITSGVPGKTRAGGQCHTPDTLVETKKEIIKIKEVKISDEIKAFDISNKKIIFAKCTNKWTKKEPSIIEILTENNKSISSSLDHTFFIIDKNKLVETSARNLSEKSVLFNDKLENEPINKIINRATNLDLVDLETSSGNFFANGILVHNSSNRFARLREEAAKEFYYRISDILNKEFLGKKEMKGIILGGPGPTKEEFVEYLNNEIRKKIIGIKDITYTDESGLHDLVERSHDLLANEIIVQERIIMTRFFEKLGKEPNKVVYGAKEVKEALDIGAVEVVLVSEDYDENGIEELESLCEKTGAKIQLISTDTREGKQLKDLGSVAAILRYELSK
ncbi:ribosomal L7Ae/L30e/S12e/Gadd45 family protein [Candidatus Woesearchaeota archaeon]|nr:ribosomal L7Ae/L30e/S12e/Gadd45 family protein [Candidatus Woesearchaeota archaeon]